ncbi:MAG: ABC transporter ATP-binding protein [Candidatus Limiplasma sp.]|nr:ABC transporter ATP-binding protein [Candidatus Limiplasma sp.]MEA5145789.1 ABC transporter ATP-binding protein [Candidatus Limiplasma sp.]
MLALEGVNTFYGKIHALHDISFEVKRGEIVTLIGSNGAGKSTTLRTISAQLTPTSGKVYYGGNVISNTPAHEIVGLGIAHVPEGRKIFPALTVEENLQMGAFRIKDKQKNAENYERVYTLFPRLKERMRQKGGTLSGGEQQMLAIGRALMSEPTLLLMDEPSMGLAPMLVEVIFESIRQLNQQGITILLVEQNAKKALKVSHRGYVLQTGAITLSGTGRELLRNDVVREAYLG